MATHESRIPSFFLLTLLAPLLSGQTIRHVPSAYPTIQLAIIYCQPGDTVLVAPGTYVENIDLLGKVITVKGAGPGQSIIDGNQQGSVVTFKWHETSQTVLDGFTLRNGSGTWMPVLASGLYTGGGIIIQSQGIGYPTPTIRNCEITANQCPQGAGVFCNTIFTLENCHIHGNVAAPLPWSPSLPGFGGIYSTGQITMRGCVVENNVDGGLRANHGDLHDCIFRNNGGYGARLFLYPQDVIERCQFIGNFGQGIGGGLWTLGSATQIRDCVIAGNQAAFAAGLYIGGSSTLDVVNCTIVGNVTGLPNPPSQAPLCGGQGGDSAGIYFDYVTNPGVGTTTVRNTVVRDNIGGPQIGFCLQFGTAGLPTVTLENSNIQGGWTGLGSGNFDLPPLFRDPANHDYHLMPGSPCIDAGTTTGLMSTTDFEGDPRLVHGAVDVGADEASIGNHPAMQSRVGASLGGPYDVLLANGSAGSASHRVVAAQGKCGQISMVLAPASTGSPRFLVWGQLGEPAFSDVVNLPFGLGPMAVIPCPLLPSYQPLLFTLVDNFGPDPCPPLLPSTPAPWTSGPLPPVFFPLTLTLQGLYETLPGQIEVTNGIIYEIR